MSEQIDLGVELAKYAADDGSVERCVRRDWRARAQSVPGGGMAVPLADVMASGFNVPPKPSPGGGGGGGSGGAWMPRVVRDHLLQWSNPHLPPIVARTWLPDDVQLNRTNGVNNEDQKD